MPEGLRGLLVGDWWRYAISLVGTLILTVGLASVLLDGRLTGTELRQVAALILFALALIAVGARVAMVVRDADRLALILGWLSLGVLALAAGAAWYGVVLPTVETDFERALVFLSILAGGALFGAVVGYYDVRVRELADRAGREQARRELLDERQRTLSSLTGILRHQVLNGLAVVRGQAELLDAGKTDPQQASDIILRRADEMEATVERIETLVDILAHTTDTETIAVEEAIQRARKRVGESAPDLDITVSGDSDATVEANELLHLALAELFDNSVVHADGAVVVTVDSGTDVVQIEVTDEGPGIELHEEALFEPNERGRGSEGDGLGLYFAALVVDQYDGEIRLADGDTGATLVLDLPPGDTS